MRVKLEDLRPAFRRQAEEQLAVYERKETAQVGHLALPGLEAGRGRKPTKTELAYRREVLDRAASVRSVTYEGLTFRMANGHRYTPDFVVRREGGQIECHEVKGGYALGSQQRARLAFDQARVEFSWVVWVWAVRTKDGWEIGG